MEITIKQFNELMSKVVLVEEMLMKIWAKLEKVNDRTKVHTKVIKAIEHAIRPID